MSSRSFSRLARRHRGLVWTLLLAVAMPSTVQAVVAGLVHPTEQRALAEGAAVGVVAPTGPRLMAVSASLGAESTTLVIEASAPVSYVMSQPDPFTVLVDLRNVRAVGADNNVETRFGAVAGVSLEDATMADGVPSTRVRVRLTDETSFNVRSARNLILVEVAEPTGLPSVVREEAAATPVLERAAAPIAPPDAAGADETTVSEPVTTGDAAPAVSEALGDIARRRVAARPGAEPMTALFQRPRLESVDASALFPVSLTGLTGRLGVPRGAAPTVVAPAASRAVGGGERDVLTARLAAPPPVQQQADGDAPPPEPVANAKRSGPETIGTRRAFTGHPVSLDFQDADLRAVLRTFTEISGLNMVIDPEVQGAVNVSLTEVPWDQALDVILQANKLDYTIDGTIVRIAPVTVLTQELEERRRQQDEERLAGDLEVLPQTLSYAKAEDLKPLLENAVLSERGTVQVDARTNTLIIKDLAANLTTAQTLIGQLDSPQPQVEIEARIVQTTREFARAIGVQWGGMGRLSQDLANTTGIGFPNQGSVSGRTGQIQGPFTGDQTRNVGTAVDLGVEGASSAAGVALGSINGAVNLDVALSALERDGHARLLSTPRVSTQNNVEAEITQGVQIPYQTVANNTVTVAFKDAALTLKVTPQITDADTVIMRISVENAAPDFSRAIKDIPPIDTQRAITQVLVNDGQTTVIGGIYLSREQTSEDQTPGLSRIPILGWLFRRQSVRDESRELLIFITPRITRA